MKVFAKENSAGGFMNVIRCDEPSYLIWKWHPEGKTGAYADERENAIRFGSSLRVKDGEVAVFVYKHKDGTMQDFIEGPYDEILKTKNLPILANIIGLAYDEGTPFQAEVYFINTAKIIQIPFVVPYFDIYDPRYLDFGVPTAIRGKMTFNIADYKEFIKLHRLTTFNLEMFQEQTRNAMSRFVKGVVANIPEEHNIPVVQIERKITLVNDIVEANIREKFEKDFGVNIVSVDISAIDVNKSSDGYKQLKEITLDLASATAKAQGEINIKNLQDMQRINAENVEETMRIQREEAQYAQHKQTQSANVAVYQIEKQAEVGIAGANALGQMGANGSMEMSGSGGMNPAAMMTGMAMGGVVGQNMAGMMNGMMSGLNSPQENVGQSQMVMTPPPIPALGYHVVKDGQAIGPFGLVELTQMSKSGKFSKESLVWKPGMTDWIKAGMVQELAMLWNSSDVNRSEIPPIPSV